MGTELVGNCVENRCLHQAEDVEPLGLVGTVGAGPQLEACGRSLFTREVQMSITHTI